MATEESTSHGPLSRRAGRAVVVVDVVESVRLMELDADDFIHRWLSFVSAVQTTLLPPRGGRLVKSLGDGLMLEFEAVPPAIECATAMLSLIDQGNQGLDAERSIQLRIGLNVADVMADDRDIYGPGVNVAARIATLAGPGEIVVAADAAEQLVSGVDVDMEDLGDCHLKHVLRPVRCMRVGPVGARPVLDRGSALLSDLRPCIAVIPFQARSEDANQLALGDALADDVIGALSQSSHLRVVSRLSTAAFRDGRHGLEAIRERLGATYVLSGSLRISGERVRVNAELADARNAQVVWARSSNTTVGDIFAGQDDTVPELVAHVSTALIDRELRRVQSLPIPTLDAYSLFLGAVSLLHRLSGQDYARCRDLLNHLSERIPRSSSPHAMIAKWHVQRMVQGWSNDPAAEGLLARAAAKRAIALNPMDSFALAVDGLVAAHVSKDLDTAEARYTQALAANPQEPFAWAFLSGLHSYRNDVALAEAAADQALQLSPIDPARFLFDSYAAVAKLAAGKFETAIEHARSSLRRNVCHTGSYRVLAIGLSLAGRLPEAREAAQRMLALEPQYTLREFRRRFPGSGTEQAGVFEQALRAAGVPA